jgi:hypothetical protein
MREGGIPENGRFKTAQSKLASAVVTGPPHNTVTKAEPGGWGRFSDPTTTGY